MISSIIARGFGFGGLWFIPTAGLGNFSSLTTLTQNKILRAYPGQSRIKTFVHDPDSRLGYSIDYSSCLLSGDTIISSSWTVPTSLVRGMDAISTIATSIIIAGGTLKTSPVVTNHIVTANGLEWERSFILKVKNT